MAKLPKPPNPHGIGTKSVDKKQKFITILKRWGIPSIREGGLEYLVATNLMILEELRKLNKTDLSLLDVWHDAFN